MSISVLGSESPAMKRRWAAIGLTPTISEPIVASDPSRHRHEVSPRSDTNRTAKNKLTLTSSTMAVVERVVISSYAETTAFSPIYRTLSEVEEWSDDSDDSGEEDHEGFSPRPAHPPSDVTSSGKSPGHSMHFPPEILIREPTSDDGNDGRRSERFILKQKIRRRPVCKDILEPPENISISGDNYCHQTRSRRMRKARSQRQIPSVTVVFEIMVVVIIAVVPFVREPTIHMPLIPHLPPTSDVLRKKQEDSYAIERMRHSNIVLSAAPNTANEISRKTCERIVCKLLVKLRRKHMRRFKEKLPNVSAKEKMNQAKQRINTIASSVGASALATIGAKLGSMVDIWLASVNVAPAIGGTFIAKIEPILSRILPTFSTIGTAIGASLGALIGIKVADIILTRLEEVQRDGHRVRESSTRKRHSQNI